MKNSKKRPNGRILKKETADYGSTFGNGYREVSTFAEAFGGEEAGRKRAAFVLESSRVWVGQPLSYPVGYTEPRLMGMTIHEFRRRHCQSAVARRHVVAKFHHLRVFRVFRDHPRLPLSESSFLIRHSRMC